MFLSKSSPLLLAFQFLAIPAFAHDTGFGHSRRTLFFSAATGEILLEYRIQMNMDEALIEMTKMDENRDGQISGAEQEGFLAGKAAALAQNLEFRAGSDAKPHPEFVRCQLGHSLVQVYLFRFKTDAKEVFLVDHNFCHKPGRLRVRHADGLEVALAEKADLLHTEQVSLRITFIGTQPSPKE